MGRLDGTISIVTGAGIGQGRSTALMLAREGAKVVAADVSGAEKDTSSNMADEIVPLHANVTRALDMKYSSYMTGSYLVVDGGWTAGSWSRHSGEG